MNRKHFNFFLFIVLILLSTELILNIKTDKLGEFKTGMTATLKELESLRQSSKKFDPNTVTKYFKNQSPPSNKDEMFTDTLFPPNLNSIEGKDSEGKYIDEKTIEISKKMIDDENGGLSQLKWVRALNYFKKIDFSVFKDSISPRDIIQREIGNCYFLSAIAAVAEFPHLIYQLFRTVKPSRIGYYELVLFIDGEWQVVILDDYFVVNPVVSRLKYAGSREGKIWVMLLEKAWAKVNGGFANIISGRSSDSYYALTGFWSQNIQTKNTNREEIWQMLSQGEKNSHVMAATTNFKFSEEELKGGLIDNHAYTFIGTLELQGKKSTIRLVKLRNPWGKYEWTGDWSDKSKKWTKDLIEQANLVKKDDGIFHMNFNDFLRLYQDIDIGRVRYDYSVKIFENSGNKEMSYPSVYNLSLEEDSFISFETFLRHPRFNRGKGSDLDKITSMILGSYDTNNNLTFLDSKCKNQEVIHLSGNYKKGNYVLWVYNTYHTFPDPKPDKYIVRILSQTSKFKVDRVGFDDDYSLIKLLINSKIIMQKDDLKVSGNIFYNTKGEVPNTCIGYFKLSNIGIDSSKFILNINNNADQIMRFLNPYNEQQIYKININLPSYSEFLVLNIAKKSERPFEIKAKLAIDRVKNSVSDKILFVKDLNVTNLLIPSEKLNETIVDYTTPSLDDAKAFQNSFNVFSIVEL